jgi:MFS family permease
MQSFVTTFNQLLALRFLLGISVAGVWLITPTFLAEIMPVHNRGLYVVMYCCGWPLGSTLSVAIATVALPNWRSVLRMAAVPSAVLPIAAFFLLDESPRFHIKKGMWKEVKAVIKEQLYGNRFEPLAVGAPSSDVVDAVPDSGKADATVDSNGFSLIRKSPKTYGPILAFALFFCSLSAGSWGLGTWLPIIIERKSGAGGEKLSPLKVVMFNSIVDFIAIALAACFVDKFGRKRFLLFASLAASACSFALSLAKTEASAMLLSGCHQMAQAILWVVVAAFCAESFGTGIRSTVTGVVSAFSRVSMIFAIAITGYFITKNVNGPLYFVSSAYAAAALATFFLPEDTTGKSMG